MRFRVSYLIVFCLGLSHSTWAQEDAKSIDAFKSLVNPTTIVVAQFDMPRLSLSKEIADVIRADKDAQPIIGTLSSIRSKLGPLLDDQVLIMVDVPFSPAHAPVRFIAKKPPAVDMAKVNASLKALRFGPALVEGDWLVTTPAGNLTESNKILVGSETLPGNDSALSNAWTTVKDMPARVLIVPPAYLLQSYEELMPRLPDRWGGVATTVITEGMQWAAVGFDPANSKMKITIQSKNAAAAERLVAELPKLLQVAATSAPAGTLKPALESFKLEKSAINRDRIEVTVSDPRSISLATSAVARTLSAIIDPLNIRQKQDRFKQLALAIHNYVQANQALPPSKAARRADGSSDLSWRVHILPYIGQQQLYSEFKLNERWDSEHNRKLLDKMPDLFAAVPSPALTPALPAGYTTTLAPKGEGTMFGGNKPVTFDMVKDGTSNTIMFVEVQADRAIPWTAPMDYEFPIADPANGLAIGNDGQFLCALADGSVQLLPGNMSKETLLHLFQMNDGHAIQRP